jgi:hypothetical protein
MWYIHESDPFQKLSRLLLLHVNMELARDMSLQIFRRLNKDFSSTITPPHLATSSLVQTQTIPCVFVKVVLASECMPKLDLREEPSMTCRPWIVLVAGTHRDHDEQRRWFV